MDTTGEYDMTDLLALLVNERVEDLSARRDSHPNFIFEGRFIVSKDRRFRRSTLRRCFVASRTHGRCENFTSTAGRIIYSAFARHSGQARRGRHDSELQHGLRMMRFTFRFNPRLSRLQSSDRKAHNTL